MHPMTTLRFVFLLLMLFVLTPDVIAQQAILYGTVKSKEQQALVGATVAAGSQNAGTYTNERGEFELQLQAGDNILVSFSYLGFEKQSKSITIKSGERKLLNVFLDARIDSLPQTIISDKFIRDQPGLIRVDPKTFEFLPNVSGGIEGFLKMLGANSNNELSSQYSVRGGNFDENLIYVNDFEIYRPFLIRSGQQEGLSFINPDLVGSILFSTGGFQAKYGDKLSSVLDVTYKKPKRFAASTSASLLGANVHVEGRSKNYRLSYLMGARYRTNRYLLGTLDISGQYQPTFADLQALFSYQLSEKTVIEYLANGSFNRYYFVPEDRVTTFGFVKRVLRLNIYFDGAEDNRFNTLMNGIAIRHEPNKRLMLKWLAAAYYNREDERFDVTGDYFIGEVQTDIGQSDFGQTLYSLGVGTTQDWGRNFLDAAVFNVGHRGTYMTERHFLKWGLTAQHEYIYDRLLEWQILDSAGYHLPYSNTEITTASYVKSENILQSNRLHGFMQDTWNLRNDSVTDLTITYGARFNYWTYNNQFFISPRLQFSWQPKKWTRDYVFRASVGSYNQPPFYREMRRLDGSLNPEIRAQRSIHIVAGSDHNFVLWNRPFKFVTEAYYKFLYDINTYELDNVRIRYYADNGASGFARGIDFRLNGELVKDAESWVSLSLLDTRENLKNDFYYVTDTSFTSSGEIESIDSTRTFPGFIPRPTDQRLTFAIFMQDYIPGNDRFKVHLNLVFATGLPVGPPDLNRFRDTLRLPPYRRVDIGFSAMLIGHKKRSEVTGVHKYIRSMWVSMEVFNLLGISNTISYLWLKDFFNTTYAVPNYLTTRRLNLRLQVNF